ncbi:EI24 domain-containing protein [Pseudooceanicola sp. CBS1P-1]|uniref:Sulfate transporter family protein n=1 Tax=Pseudooceanicola albus TaxID=2692189 RepID=A0A6L7GAN3_9RHOB|nr:EI24 domain-containing protein [Pseudooceanicola endophyticus]MXN21115.1 hypothetical protein [Pseudooceanicola albus]
MILKAFARALSQIGDPRFRKVLFLGLGLTLGLLIAACVVVWYGLEWLTGPDVTLPWIGTVHWLDTLAAASGVLVMMGLSVFLMIPVASAFTSLFLDDVAEAVEHRHYPQLPDVPGQSIPDAIRDTFSFLGVMIVANILAFVLYLIFPPFAPLIFWGLNGFLLGREYYTLAAVRRLPADQVKDQRRRNTPTIWAAGILMAIPLSIPLLNLVIPIIGAATFTHIFHGTQKARRVA